VITAIRNLNVTMRTTVITFKFLIAVITVHQSGALEGPSIGEEFADSFGVFDVVFAIFGVLTAYHVGRGLN